MQSGTVPPLESFSPSPEWAAERSRLLEVHADWVRAIETAVVNLGRQRGKDGFTIREAVDTLGDISGLVPRPVIGATASKLLNIDHLVRVIGRTSSHHRAAHGRTVAVYVLSEVA